MAVIKLELVIKIKTQENMKTGAYAQEVKVLENESRQRKRVDGWTVRFKGKRSEMKTE